MCDGPRRLPVRPLIVVMGVSGSGKSTVGAALASRAGLAFVDADDLHTPGNIAKMSAGQPLTDEDRAEWLRSVAEQLELWRRQGVGGVLACSALKRRYRQPFSAPDVQLVYLLETPDVVRERFLRRVDHFMPASLIESQFQILEPPDPDEGAIVAPPETTVASRCDAIFRALAFVSASRRPE